MEVIPRVNQEPFWLLIWFETSNVISTDLNFDICLIPQGNCSPVGNLRTCFWMQIFSQRYAFNVSLYHFQDSRTVILIRQITG